MGRDEVLRVLKSVKDPELPEIDVVELGIIRDVVVSGDEVRVDVTPTYSGCPAMQAIEQDIVATLMTAGFREIDVRTVFSPAWTTAWLGDETKQKLRAHGIAPPVSDDSAAGGAEQLVMLTRARPKIECPFCGSAATDEKSVFGSTACKAIHYCRSCQQPFNYFKAF